MPVSNSSQSSEMYYPDYHIEIGNATDIGKLREQNEDYLAHFASSFGYCVIVCDGMGGHAGGQIAAQHSVLAIQQYLQDPQNEESNTPAALEKAIEFANFQLREMVVQNPVLNGMGTTCVLAVIKDGLLYTAHAGDSRIYLVRKKRTDQITKDHSSVQKLIDTGILTEQEAELSDKKNQIEKAIGVFDKVKASITGTPICLHKNDKILLCSDGLTAHVNKDLISETILGAADVQEAALKLVELANAGGGSDNITIQLVHYTGKTIRRNKKLFRSKRVTLLFLIVVVLALTFYGYKRLNSKGEKTENNGSPPIKVSPPDTIGANKGKTPDP